MATGEDKIPVDELDLAFRSSNLGDAEPLPAPTLLALAAGGRFWSPPEGGGMPLFALGIRVPWEPAPASKRAGLGDRPRGILEPPFLTVTESGKIAIDSPIFTTA